MEHRPGGDEVEIRRAGSGGRAREWSLVLSAAGIPSRLVQDSGGVALRVASDDASRAAQELAAYTEDVAVRDATSTRARRREPEVAGPAPLGLALLVALALLGFYAWTGPAGPANPWFARGGADALAMRQGQWWRAVTALCLHVDLAHLTANVLFGTLFLAAAGRSVGPGLAFALVVLAGAGGNGINALLRGVGHTSVGASTAVFGAVGLLAGLGVVRRVQRGDRWRLALLPFAGGLGILAMLGSGGGRVDVFAHLFGLSTGLLLGLVTALVRPKPPGPLAQAGWGVAAAVALWGCWVAAV